MSNTESADPNALLESLRRELDDVVARRRGEKRPMEVRRLDREEKRLRDRVESLVRETKGSAEPVSIGQPEVVSAGTEGTSVSVAPAVAASAGLDLVAIEVQVQDRIQRLVANDRFDDAEAVLSGFTDRLGAGRTHELSLVVSDLRMLREQQLSLDIDEFARRGQYDDAIVCASQLEFINPSQRNFVALKESLERGRITFGYRRNLDRARALAELHLDEKERGNIEKPITEAQRLITETDPDGQFPELATEIAAVRRSVGAEDLRRAEIRKDERTAAALGRRFELLTNARAAKAKAKTSPCLYGKWKWTSPTEVVYEDAQPVDEVIEYYEADLRKLASEKRSDRVRLAQARLQEGNLSAARSLIDDPEIRQYAEFFNNEDGELIDRLKLEIKSAEGDREESYARLREARASTENSVTLTLLRRVAGVDQFNPLMGETVRAVLEQSIIRSMRSLDAIEQLGDAQVAASRLEQVEADVTTLEAIAQLDLGNEVHPGSDQDVEGDALVEANGSNVALRRRLTLLGLRNRVEAERARLASIRSQLEQETRFARELEDWIAGSAHDEARGQDLLKGLGRVSNPEHQILIDRARALLGYESEVNAVRDLMRDGEYENASLQLTALLERYPEKHGLRGLVRQVKRAQDFKAACSLIDGDLDRNGIKRAREVLDRLALDESAVDLFSRATLLDRLEGCRERDRIWAEGEEALGDAQAFLDRRQYRDALNFAERVATARGPVGSEARRVVGEIRHGWWLSMQGELEALGRQGDAQGIVRMLAMQAKEFPVNEFARANRNAAFKVVSEAWKVAARSAHVSDAAEGLVRAALQLAEPGEEREDALKGLRDLSIRRDFPKIEAALRERDQGLVTALLHGLSQLGTDDATLAKYRAQLHLLDGNYAAARSQADLSGNPDVQAQVNEAEQGEKRLNAVLAGIRQFANVNRPDSEPSVYVGFYDHYKELLERFPEPALRERIQQWWTQTLSEIIGAQRAKIESMAAIGMDDISAVVESLKPFQRLEKIGALGEDLRPQYEAQVARIRANSARTFNDIQRIIDSDNPTLPAAEEAHMRLQNTQRVLQAALPTEHFTRAINDQATSLAGLIADLQTLQRVVNEIGKRLGTATEALVFATCQNQLANLPNRFAGIQNATVVALRREIRELESKFEQQSQRVAAVKSAWDAEDYARVIREANTASRLAAVEDPFGLLQKISVTQDNETIVGPQLIAERAQGKMGYADRWERYLQGIYIDFDIGYTGEPKSSDLDRLVAELEESQRRNQPTQIASVAHRLVTNCRKALERPQVEWPSPLGSQRSEELRTLAHQILIKVRRIHSDAERIVRKDAEDSAQADALWAEITELLGERTLLLSKWFPDQRRVSLVNSDINQRLDRLLAIRPEYPGGARLKRELR